MARREKPEFIVVPWTVAVDNSEQLPYYFDGMVSDAKEHYLPLIVRVLKRSLMTGDYTIDGLEEKISVERKSLEDLFSTIGGHRDRFEAELERLNQMDVAAVVVEASWMQILKKPPKHSGLKPKTVYRSVIAWSQRFIRVHWFMMDNRRLGEVTTFRFLERYWRDLQEKSK